MQKFEKFTGIKIDKVESAINRDDKIAKKIWGIHLKYLRNNEKNKNVIRGGEKGLLDREEIKNIIEPDWNKVTNEMRNKGLLEVESWKTFMEKIHQEFPKTRGILSILLTEKFELLEILKEYKELSENEKSEIDYLNEEDKKFLEEKDLSRDAFIFVNGPSPSPKLIRENKTVGYRRHFVYYLAQLIEKLNESEMKKNVILLIPEADIFFNLDDPNNEIPNFDYDLQTTFERIGRKLATVNIYWMPRYDESFPGKTTLIEMALVHKQSDIMLVYYGDPKREEQAEYSRSYRKDRLKYVHIHMDNIYDFFDYLLASIYTIR